jgi:hypothetical protein
LRYLYLRDEQVVCVTVRRGHPVRGSAKGKVAVLLSPKMKNAAEIAAAL